MKIKRIEHVAIATDGLDRAMALFRDTFGIPLEY